MPRGLYLLADESIRPFTDWPGLLPRILDQGPALVQYRAKRASLAGRRDHARQLLQWCRQRDIPLLVNDDLALAREIGADGVHLGREDAAIMHAREQLGPTALIGATCYADIVRAAACVAAGASYVSFGRLFDSRTKPDAPGAPLEILRQARQRLDAPLCGIGGIHAGNAASVLDHGATLICVGGGILRAADPVTAARKLATICATF